MTPENLYIHVPFCNGKCDYCAFYSEPQVREDLADQWLEKITADLLKNDLSRPLRTVYLGGGTPTALPPKTLKRLMKLIQSLSLAPDAEISSECNPGSLTAEKAEIISGTINRVSMGVQSFQPELLRKIGRRTNPEQVAQTFDLLRNISGIKRIGMDLICALPDQTMKQWESDLVRAVSFHPEHISAYMLIPEPGTPYTEKYGEVPPLSEELQAEMWEFAGEFLEMHGMPRYEISNHAVPGGECRHNQNVWHGETYLGLGPSACSFDGTDRFTNAAPLSEWLNGAPPEIDSVSPEIRKREVFMMGLRTVRGWKSSEFDWKIFLPELQQLETDGLIMLSNEVVKPTKQGLLCWNTIAETLI
ncbi:MAG: radical SAM family heme chaperone HemW [Lentisphaerae bacterium]|nr:radical SAM family heme chaperone HemW [Lentisphaerota bacterium]